MEYMANLKTVALSIVPVPALDRIGSMVGVKVVQTIGLVTPVSPVYTD
tara:strand:- start:3387 stop:3530 length:144 start_codon:yes stop_codon:yes gene_type:complete